MVRVVNRKPAAVRKPRACKKPQPLRTMASKLVKQKVKSVKKYMVKSVNSTISRFKHNAHRAKQWLKSEPLVIITAVVGIIDYFLYALSASAPLLALA